MRPRWNPTIGAAVLLLAACSSGDEPASTETASTTSTTEAATATTTPAATRVDRLVVVDGDGIVVAMDRDGGNTRVLGAEGEIPFQPVWSPDGARIAYASRAANPGLVVVDATTGEQSRLETGSASFYFHWSPRANQLGSLRNGPTGIVFEMIDTGQDLSIREVETGQPFYFDWSPAGDRLVAHIGANRFDLLSPLPQGPDPEPLAPAPAIYRAPQWIDAGVLGVLERDDGVEIAIVTPEGVETPIVRVEGLVQFEASRDGRQLAVASLSPDDGNSVSVLFQADQPLPGDQLYVVDIATGEATQITTETALSFFWSPDGTKLLFMEPAEEQGRLRWSVWEDGVVTPGPDFTPNVGWITEFLPFFDQYARSMRLWAPDATAYAFPGRIGDESGIWVAPADGGEPTLISDGSWVSWSQS